MSLAAVDVVHKGAPVLIHAGAIRLAVAQLDAGPLFVHGAELLHDLVVEAEHGDEVGQQARRGRSAGLVAE